jgi:hypothetical protein
MNSLACGIFFLEYSGNEITVASIEEYDDDPPFLQFPHCLERSEKSGGANKT